MPGTVECQRVCVPRTLLCTCTCHMHMHMQHTWRSHPDPSGKNGRVAGVASEWTIGVAVVPAAARRAVANFRQASSV